MAADAIVLLYDPPTFLNVATIIKRTVLIIWRKPAFLTAHEEGGEGAHLVFFEMEIGHAQFLGFGFYFAFVPDVRFGELLFENAFVVVLRLLGWTFCQACEVLCFVDWLLSAA